jgi:DNA-binding transcriptional regulator YiaG
VYRFPKKLDILGNHIHKKRKELYLKQTDLAKLFHVTSATIGCWERGSKEIAIKHYPKIMEFLGYCPMEKPPQTLGEKIALHRKYSGYSQTELARFFHATFSKISRWERNLSTPTKEERRKLQKLIHLPL